MYTILFKDGKNMIIAATKVECCAITRTFDFYDHAYQIASINIDNIVGWVKSDKHTIEVKL